MRGLIDDRRHSQLSKGRSPVQTRIDALGDGVGPTEFGRCSVLAIRAQSALTDFTMGGHAAGLAWSVNPYVGCLHGCRYCFVPRTLHAERDRWGSYVLVKDNLPSILRAEVSHRPAKTTYLSTATDPYQAAEADHRVTRGCLRVLAHVDWPVDVLTRSPLVMRDRSLLRRFGRLRVGLSVPTLDDEARRLLEPAAPPIGARLKALEGLSDAGLETYVNYAPAYPPTGGVTARDIAVAFRGAGVRWVNYSAWKYQPAYLGRLWDGLHKSAWADLARFVGDGRRQANWEEELRQELRHVGSPMREGFFNDPFPAEAPRVSAPNSLDRFGEPARVHDAAAVGRMPSLLHVTEPEAGRGVQALSEND